MMSKQNFIENNKNIYKKEALTYKEWVLVSVLGVENNKHTKYIPEYNNNRKRRKDRKTEKKEINEYTAWETNIYSIPLKIWLTSSINARRANKCIFKKNGCVNSHVKINEVTKIAETLGDISLCVWIEFQFHILIQVLFYCVLDEQKRRVFRLICIGANTNNKTNLFVSIFLSFVEPLH